MVSNWDFGCGGAAAMPGRGSACVALRGWWITFQWQRAGAV